MAYLNEDGLETLVGKIKGQVIELTSAEYRQLPATKNTDNKLYFVNDEAYAYQIDDEPTADSTGLVKSGGVYNWTSKIGSGTLTTTAQTLIPAVNELNNDLITEVLYASTEVRVYKNNRTILCTFNNATIAQITTALQNVPRPGGIVRNIVWNYIDTKSAVISVGTDAVTFISTNPWGVISDTSKLMHGEITWLVSN